VPYWQQCGGYYVNPSSAAASIRDGRSRTSAGFAHTDVTPTRTPSFREATDDEELLATVGAHQRYTSDMPRARREDYLAWAFVGKASKGKIVNGTLPSQCASLKWGVSRLSLALSLSLALAKGIHWIGNKLILKNIWLGPSSWKALDLRVRSRRVLIVTSLCLIAAWAEGTEALRIEKPKVLRV
jgi:hypothetical protein